MKRALLVVLVVALLGGRAENMAFSAGRESAKTASSAKKAAVKAVKQERKAAVKREKVVKKNVKKAEKNIKKAQKNKNKGVVAKIETKKDEQIDVIGDRKISKLIDSKEEMQRNRPIRVSVKGKGVAKQCLPKNNITPSEQKKVNKALEDRKANLKEFILKSLQANNISEGLTKYIYDNLEHIKMTVAKDKEVRKRTTMDFIERYNVPERAKQGAIYKKMYQEELQTVEDLFYVDKNAILTIWAMETKYGDFIGKTPAFNALYSAAMNAYNIARLDYFTNNLVMLAKLVDYGYFKPEVISSFDGGLGGCQFMPDSFYRYAVSYDGGKADIINNNKDVFASIGNYLYSTGWRHHEGILTEVVLPEGFDICKAGMNTSRKVSEWKKMGVELHPNGIGAVNMLDDEAKASVMIVDIDDTSKSLQEKRAFLVYDNYKVILGYNTMPKYGIVAGLIYEGIGNE